MQYWTDSAQIELNKDKTVVVIGKFDGVHLGHQMLFRTAVAKAQELQAKSLAFTFDRNLGRSLLITTKQERKELIEQCGMDILMEYPFHEIMNLEAEQFVHDILIKQLHACMIIAGPDCGFGKNRTGNVQLLQELSSTYGFELLVMDKVKYQDSYVSSTLVRELIEQGMMEEAQKVLGHPYFITGQVVKGNQLGRTWDFPTINMLPASDKLIPPNGVYASRVFVNQEWKNSVTNIGKKPTVDSHNEMITVETYIFDFEGDLYHQNLCVKLYDFIRPEHRFESFGQLKQQIRQDNAKCRQYFEKMFDI